MSTVLPIGVNKDLDRHVGRGQPQPSRVRPNTGNVTCTA